MTKPRPCIHFIIPLVFIAVGCEQAPQAVDTILSANDPDTAQRVIIDRFSEEAGTLFVRDDSNDLPRPGEPIDFDAEPFFVIGLQPDGNSSGYYQLDVQPRIAAPVYVLISESDGGPVAGQLNIFDQIPGDQGYSDFWQMQHVLVPSDYVANTVTSLTEIEDAGFAIQKTNAIVNCPMVPDGSIASRRLNGGRSELELGWYRGQVVTYFTFEEDSITVDDADNPRVPMSEIYMTFNVNPDEEGGGFPSGVRKESESNRSHNVLAAIPGDPDYSPFGIVNIYDNSDFDSVIDLASAESSNILLPSAFFMNCPVVSLGE
ncbi:MAG: hypothetical protein ACPGXK_05515 [Phycisphaerae bacterium]